MKEIFLWRRGKKYAEYDGVTEADNRKIDWSVLDVGDPLPPLEQWEAPRLTQYLGDGKKPRKPKKIGDASFVGRPLLISQRAADALKDIWDRHATLYPVHLDDAPEQMYYMVIVKTVLDCLDEDASRLVRDRKGRICSVYDWVFKEGCLDDSDIFRLPYNETAFYVTTRFKERVVAAKLKGFAFYTHFWDADAFVS